MSKGVVGVAFALVLFVSSVSYSVVERVLIDFPQFEKNMAVVAQKDAEIHQQTIQDKKDVRLDFTQYGYPEVKLTGEDWKMDNWLIVLTSSANTVRNNIYSYCKKVPSKKYGDVLGARIHFPEWRFLSWALIKPPYEFFAYYDNGQYVNETDGGGENSMPMGVLVNVGQIKLLSTWVYGLNYQHQIGLRMKDRDGVMREYFMGSTYYDGWRKLVWMNPNYTDDVRDRVLQRLPLYPKSYPYIKFDSFVVYKPEVEDSGDYIVYFKDVNVHFDRAIVREELDIDDEANWKILADYQIEKKSDELKRIGEEIYLREQEIKRQKEAGK